MLRVWGEIKKVTFSDKFYLNVLLCCANRNVEISKFKKNVIFSRFLTTFSYNSKPVNPKPVSIEFDKTKVINTLLKLRFEILTENNKTTYSCINF